MAPPKRSMFVSTITDKSNTTSAPARKKKRKANIRQPPLEFPYGLEKKIGKDVLKHITCINTSLNCMVIRSDVGSVRRRSHDAVYGRPSFTGFYKSNIMNQLDGSDPHGRFPHMRIHAHKCGISSVWNSARIILPHPDEETCLTAISLYLVGLQELHNYKFISVSGIGRANAVADIRMQFCIKETIAEEVKITEYDDFPGYVYVTDNPKTTATFFLTGKILITNFFNPTHLANVIKEATSVYLKHRDTTKPAIDKKKP